MEMEEDLGDCLIPRFSIQPAVENALFHGILPKGTGKIEVKVYKSGAGIKIQIKDNGIGIEKEQMEEINEKVKNGCFFRRRESGNQQTEKYRS
ncbi:MAG: sensor histidine kinase [Blautia sp.]